ncbi:MAG: hypothetical protein AAFQ66_07360 [Pseudomonadota bacterium]
MNDTVVKLGSSGEPRSYRDRLTDTEKEELEAFRSHPATSGFILFDDMADVLVAEQVDDMSAAVFANVFDICESLAEQMGQREHNSITFENRWTEIACYRWTSTRMVVFRAKGNRKKA